ncbi:MAG: hypothetical protein ABIH23_25870 [bacterium]
MTDGDTLLLDSGFRRNDGGRWCGLVCQSRFTPTKGHIFLDLVSKVIESSRLHVVFVDKRGVVSV